MKVGVLLQNLLGGLHTHTHTHCGVGVSSYFIKFIESCVKFDQLDEMLEVRDQADRLQCDLVSLLCPF